MQLFNRKQPGGKMAYGELFGNPAVDETTELTKHPRAVWCGRVGLMKLCIIHTQKMHFYLIIF